MEDLWVIVTLEWLKIMSLYCVGLVNGDKIVLSRKSIQGLDYWKPQSLQEE